MIITSLFWKGDKKFQRHSLSNTVFYIEEKDNEINLGKSESL